jgi:gamma-glutamyltranspeptidase/glutathione hydrolase
MAYQKIPFSRRHLVRLLQLGIVSSVVAGCGGKTNTAALCVAQTDAPYRQTAVIKGTKVMVTSGHIEASMAGCRVLANGGLVGDAAVAVQAMLGVVEPFASGLAAGSLATLYDAKTKAVRTIEGYSAAPGDIGVAKTAWQAASDEDKACRTDKTLAPGTDQLSDVQGPINASMRAVGVPGTVRVLQEVHKSASSLPWSGLWEDAISLAEAGAPMTEYMYSTMYSDGTDRVDEDGNLLPAGGVRAWSTSTKWGPFRCQFGDIRARYCDQSDPKGERPLPVGTKIKHPELANTMRLVRDNGANAFYDPNGAVVKAILARSAQDKTKADGSNNCDSNLPTYTGTLATGGTTSKPLEGSRIPSRLRTQDFVNYKANERTPLVGQAFGHKIYTHAPPSFGGTVILESLSLLEKKGLSPTTHPWQSPQFLYLVTEASRLANADRRTVVGDPDYSNVTERVNAVLGEPHLNARAALINGSSVNFTSSTAAFGGLATTTVPGYQSKTPLVFASANTSPKAQASRLAKANRATMQRLAMRNPDSEEINTTTHFAIIDAAGNALSMTSTINSHWGAHAEAAGMLLNNNMSNFSGTSLGSDVNGFAANKRPRSSTAPSIAFDQNGRLSMVWGAAGGGPIPDYIVKSFLGHRVYGKDLQQTMNEDNWSGQLSASFYGNVELGKPIAAASVLSTMRAAPYNYTSTTFAPAGLTSGNSGIGVSYDSNGVPTYHGAADNRRHGGASGY